MFNLLMMALLQVVAGAPNAPPEAPAAETVVVPVQTPESAPTAGAEPARQNAPAPEMRRQRICEEIEGTGRRTPQRVCRTVMVPVEPAEQHAQ